MSDWLRSEKQRELRRGYAIRAYVGANGGGKTACAVFDLMPSLAAGRKVLSTARLLDFENPRPCDDADCDWPGHPAHGAAHPCWEPLREWPQFLDATNCDVLLDEVAGVASSRSSGSLPFQVARELQKLRKRDVTLSYTGPSFQRCEVIIRECTTLLTLCAGRRPYRVESADASSRAWVRNRWVKWDSFDAQEFERFSAADGVLSDRRQGKRKFSRKFGQIYRIDGSIIGLAYDSHDAVLSLGWANESGMCLECGGRRSVPKCSCGETPRVRRGLAVVASTPEPIGRVAAVGAGVLPVTDSDGGIAG